ncbi:sugar transferase [Silvibacterium sp.]|uniref:sugar transferase n=1 Tax=Silvibacterium sp. TaxID=1964179 RepID=UPI0039E32B33
MATPDFFSSEMDYPEARQYTGFVHARNAATAPDGIPGSFPIASFSYRIIKPAVDRAIILLAAPVLLPLSLLIALIVFVTSRGPVLYRHRRLGRFQQPIHVWKFRTMYQNSDELLAQHLHDDAAARLEWSSCHKLRDDPRVTLIGRFLRKTSLDEIPQLLNVLTGEMSIVGPRPIVNEEKSKYGMYLQAFSYAMPGITGLWQVSGRCDLTYEDRVQLDVRYVTRWSLWMEAKILLRTVLVMIHREGAY